MEDLRLDLMDVENRAEWRRRTRVADPSPEGFNPAWRRETATRRLLAQSCLSDCLWHCTLRLSGSVCRAKNCTSVRIPSRRVPVCWFRHFCCRMYRLATKWQNAPQKTSRRKREHEFFQTHIRPRVYWFIAHYLLFRSGPCPSHLSGFSDCVHKRKAGRPTRSDSSVPADIRPKLVVL